MPRKPQGPRTRCRIITFRFDPANPVHTKAMKLLENDQTPGYIWVKILHNLSTYEDGSPKPAHIHYYCEYKNCRRLDSVAKAIGIQAERDIMRAGYKTDMISMLHPDKSGAFLYDKINAEGPFVSGFIKYVDGNAATSEGARATLILKYIDSQEYLSYTALLRWSLKNGLYDILRRNNYGWNVVLAEHNKKV